MSKKIILGIIVIAVLAIVLLVATTEREEPIDTELETAKTIAEEWTVNSAPTYVFDGSDLAFVDAEKSEGVYVVNFSFESRAAGYGDRTDEMVAQVITPHTIEVKVEDGEVVSAVTDGVYDEIKEEIIEEALPETMKISLYFVQIVDDQEQVVSVERTIPYTLAPAKAAVEELLKGPLAHEEAEGLSTAIPEGAELNSIVIENGVAKADFNEKLQEGVAGSAWVMAIRGQIEKTLMQFDTVDEAIIMIDGESEDILQP